MSKDLTRRRFIQTTAGAAATFSALSPALGALGANERIRVGIIGTGSRGRSHVTTLKRQKDAEIVALCDVDDNRLAECVKEAGNAPEQYKDFRRLLDRKDIDAVFVTTPEHWHAIPALQAMQAGKDVYLEKPLGHTIHEGRVIADTAKKTERIVQIGLQQRSVPHWQNAVQRIQAGEIGRIVTVNVWNAWNTEEMGGNMGNPPDSDAPAGVDYDMWLGPAPKRPFNPRRFHFYFYFWWDYSSGMPCAWGVHLFDVVMWAMSTPPRSVSSAGGIYVLKDARETPDTLQTVFDCGDYAMTYSMQHANGWRRFGDKDHGIEFIGSKGVLQINRSGFQMYHEADRNTLKPYYSESVSGNDTQRHQGNFLDCMRSRKTPNASAEIGHLAAIPGYLANISHRVGRGIRWDAQREQILNDSEASGLLTKDYRKPWHL